MSRRASPLWWSILVLVVGLVPTVTHGIVVKMDNAQLVSSSDVVVYGTVEEVRGQNHLKEAIIRTHAVLKGSVSPNSLLRVSSSPSMSDSPTFAVSERVLLFLKRVEPGRFQTVGGFQGKVSLD